MRVINISYHDHANYAYYNSQAMRSVGIDSDSYILKPHNFQYPKQSTRVTQNQMFGKCRNADVVQIIHSDPDILRIFLKSKANKCVVWHTGSRYRNDPDTYNKLFNPVVDKTVCALAEFMTMGGINPVYFGITVPVFDFEPDYNTNDNLVFGHFPSNPQVKGSNVVIDALKECGVDYVNGGLITYPMHIQRLNKCDVYVEMMALTQNGKTYGSYGTSAVEASAMGKIVITNNSNPGVYKDCYGDSPLIIANTREELIDRVKWLKTLSKSDIVKLKKEFRKWAEEKHSYKASGDRMIKLLSL